LIDVIILMQLTT